MGICFSDSKDSILLNLHDVDVDMFSLNGMTFNAKVVDVYDVDTSVFNATSYEKV